MSQEKVDKYKKEKYNRKDIMKKAKRKRVISYILVGIIVLVLAIYLLYSAAISTGLYTPETQAETTTAAPMSEEELESFRQYLIDSGDKNVKEDASAENGDETTALEETTVTE